MLFCKPNLAKRARERRGGESAPALNPLPKLGAVSSHFLGTKQNLKHVLDIMSQTHFRQRSGANGLPMPRFG